MNTSANANPQQEVDFYAKLADLKLAHYQNTLLLHALIDQLTDLELIDKKSLLDKVREMDEQAMESIRQREKFPREQS